MARTPEQFSVVDSDGNETFIADDVNGSGTPTPVREILLAPGWMPEETRVVQPKFPKGAEKKSFIGRGGREVTFTIIVLRTFATLADAIAFKKSHQSSIPSIGTLTLRHSFGGQLSESTGAFEAVNCVYSNSLRVIFQYHWRGTGLAQPNAGSRINNPPA